MNMLIGRLPEKEILGDFLKSNQAEFLAIYGRRRVGKTYLIKQFFDRKNCLFFHSTGLKEGGLSDQMNRFIKSIADAFFNGADVSPRNKNNWIDIFDYLTDVMKKQVKKHQKVVLFMDELPWMATKKSKLPQALDYFWNHYWSHDTRIKLIICGSSASWIRNKVINNKGGLHNRVTQQILLQPFDLSETKKYLAARGVHLNHWHVSQIYMVTGGIPFYLSFVAQGLGSAQIIERLAFTAQGPLRNEFDNLFSSLFEDAGPYIALIRIIAGSRYGISQSEIVKKSKHFTKGGRIAARLKELKDAGFILSFKPYQHTSKGVYYRVIDEYTLFYLYWIEPEKDALQEGTLEPGYWQLRQLSSAWQSWSGLSFEAMCYKHLSFIRKKLNIPSSAVAHTWRYAPVSKTNETGVQIDLLFDRPDAVINVCEIKYSVHPVVIDKQYAKLLINKREVFIQKTATQKQVFMAMVAAHGVQENLYYDDLMTGVVTLDDFF
jgi:hypothetical protein